MTKQPPWAEDTPYFQTGRSAPDMWIEKAKKELARAGATGMKEGYANEDGRAAFLLAFTLEGESFRIVWPVLRSRGGKEAAARIQAVTMLYHDVKARCVSARVLGVRSAFLGFLVLPDGQTAGAASGDDLATLLPPMFGGQQKLLKG